MEGIASSARAVAYLLDLQNESEILVVADSADASTWHIEFQRQVDSFDEDTYCVVLPSGATEYSCLESIGISVASLTLTFLPEAAEILEVERDLEIPLELTPAEHQVLVVGLRAIVGEGFNPPRLEVS